MCDHVRQLPLAAEDKQLQMHRKRTDCHPSCQNTWGCVWGAAAATANTSLNRTASRIHILELCRWKSLIKLLLSRHSGMKVVGGRKEEGGEEEKEDNTFFSSRTRTTWVQDGPAGRRLIDSQCFCGTKEAMVLSARREPAMRRM